MLTNDASLNYRLLHPKFVHEREYLVQSEGLVNQQAVTLLSQGITININGNPYRTKPCKAIVLKNEPAIPHREPPIRYRKHIPTSWVSLTLTEGKNRQVRKMMAKADFPVLRLIRTRIERLTLDKMKPGDMMALSQQVVNHKLFGK
ncbi:MAG: pseudouridine synthase [Agriterribacter sp.]